MTIFEKDGVRVVGRVGVILDNFTVQKWKKCEHTGYYGWSTVIETFSPMYAAEVVKQLLGITEKKG